MHKNNTKYKYYRVMMLFKDVVVNGHGSQQTYRQGKQY